MILVDVDGEHNDCADDESEESEEKNRTVSCLSNSVVHSTYVFVHDPRFDAFITAVVVLNILLMAADHHPKTEEFVWWTEAFEGIFFVVYVAELVLKVTALGWTQYLKVGRA